MQCIGNHIAALNLLNFIRMKKKKNTKLSTWLSIILIINYLATKIEQKININA